MTPRFRIILGQHDGLYRVQENLSAPQGVSWLTRVDCMPSANEANLHAWIDRELAGPKVIKEYL